MWNACKHLWSRCPSDWTVGKRSGNGRKRLETVGSGRKRSKTVGNGRHRCLNAWAVRSRSPLTRTEPPTLPALARPGAGDGESGEMARPTGSQRFDSISTFQADGSKPTHPLTRPRRHFGLSGKAWWGVRWKVGVGGVAGPLVLRMGDISFGAKSHILHCSGLLETQRCLLKGLPIDFGGHWFRIPVAAAASHVP